MREHVFKIKQLYNDKNTLVYFIVHTEKKEDQTSHTDVYEATFNAKDEYCNFECLTDQEHRHDYSFGFDLDMYEDHYFMPSDCNFVERTIISAFRVNEFKIETLDSTEAEESRNDHRKRFEVKDGQIVQGSYPRLDSLMSDILFNLGFQIDYRSSMLEDSPKKLQYTKFEWITERDHYTDAGKCRCKKERFLTLGGTCKKCQERSIGYVCDDCAHKKFTCILCQIKKGLRFRRRILQWDKLYDLYTEWKWGGKSITAMLQRKKIEAIVKQEFEQFKEQK